METVNNVTRVLFVCLGNICRSPTAEGVFRSLVESEGLSGRIEADSAGTGAYHVGSPPDGRSQAAALRRGVDLSRQRARKANAGDFKKFDYVLAMDRDNLSDLARICPKGEEGRLKLFLGFAPGLGRSDVPDPYYGGPHGFEAVLDLIATASKGLLDDIRANHLKDI
ncbi:MAG: low molecular weight protein-tyrosine-phosphatase [Rhodospirillales bacterium]